jgi:hypothetical protein
MAAVGCFAWVAMLNPEAVPGPPLLQQRIAFRGIGRNLNPLGTTISTVHPDPLSSNPIFGQVMVDAGNSGAAKLGASIHAVRVTWSPEHTLTCFARQASGHDVSALSDANISAVAGKHIADAIDSAFAPLLGAMTRSHKSMRDAVQRATADPAAIANSLRHTVRLCPPARALQRAAFYNHARITSRPTASSPTQPSNIARDHSQCLPRVVIFGGSMTWGKDAVWPEFRPFCPGCADTRQPKAKLLPTRSGSQTGFAELPHCCSWPGFLQRYVSAAFGSRVVNMAVRTVRIP